MKELKDMSGEVNSNQLDIQQLVSLLSNSQIENSAFLGKSIKLNDSKDAVGIENVIDINKYDTVQFSDGLKSLAGKVITICSFSFHEYDRTIRHNSGNRSRQIDFGARIICKTEDGIIHDVKTSAKCVIKQLKDLYLAVIRNSSSQDHEFSCIKCRVVEVPVNSKSSDSKLKCLKLVSANEVVVGVNDIAPTDKSSPVFIDGTK